MTVSVIHIKKNSSHFVVENSFVDNFMCDANGSFVKVYLYVLRHSEDKAELTLSKIADVLNMLQADVLSAFKYWDGLGVLKFVQQDKNTYSVNIESNSSNINDSDTTAGRMPSDNANISDGAASAAKNSAKGAPTYSMAELNNTIMGNERIKSMFNISSQILNKTLSSNDMKVLYSFYDYLKLPVEVIFSLLEYCVTINKNNMRYIEKVAYTWAENEINTPRKAGNYIKQKTQDKELAAKYRKMFKITDRDFSEEEFAVIKKWINEYKRTDDDIIAAYNKTVMNTGKVAIKYMDAILSNKDGQTQFKGNVKKNNFNSYDGNYGQSDIEKQLLNKRMSKKRAAEE